MKVHFLFLILRIQFLNHKIMSLPGTITRADYLPYQDYCRLVQSLIEEKKYWWACYCVLSFCTSLRYSDVSRIKWKDVLEQKKIVITAQKTGKVHVIPLGTNASAHLATLYEYLGKPRKDSIILQGEEEGKPKSIQQVNRVLKTWKYRYDLNIDNFSTHTFRKTFGRYVYERGGCSEKSLLYLNQIFNHANLDTTRIYLGIRDEEIAGIFDSITF